MRARRGRGCCRVLPRMVILHAAAQGGSSTRGQLHLAPPSACVGKRRTPSSSYVVAVSLVLSDWSYLKSEDAQARSVR
eukprot:5599494-Pleurochrysis_carterae.AAC.6